MSDAAQQATSKAMCPSCGEWGPWPPVGRCVRCGAELTGQLAAAIWDIDRQAHGLQGRRRELVAQLRSQAAQQPQPRPSSPLPPPPPGMAIPSRAPAPDQVPGQFSHTGAGQVPPAPPSVGTGLTGLRAQTILGLAGVGLLGLAALFFAAVTWQSLGPGMKVTILAASTIAAAGLGMTLTGRGLRSTGGALAGLATVLALVTMVAAERLELVADLHSLGGITLGLVASTATAWVLSGNWRREGDDGVRVAGMTMTAQATWGLAAWAGSAWLLAEVDDDGWWLPVVALGGAAVTWAATPILQRSILTDVLASVLVLVASVAGPAVVVEGPVAEATIAAVATVLAAATWFGLARNRSVMPLGWFLTVSTSSGLLAAAVFRLVPDQHPEWTYAGVLAAMVMLLAIRATAEDDALVPAGWSERGPAIAGLWPAVVPALGIAVAAVAQAGGSLVARAVRPWRDVDMLGELTAGGPDDGVAILGAVAILMIIAVTIWERQTQRLTVASLLLLVVGAPASLWHVEAESGALWVAAIVPTIAIVVLIVSFPQWLPAPDRKVLVPTAALAAFAAIGWIAETREGTLVGAAVALAVVAMMRWTSDRLERDAVVVTSSAMLVAMGSWSAAIIGATASDLLDLGPVVTGIAASVAATAAAWLLHRGDENDPVWVLLVAIAQLVTVGVALSAEEPLAASSAGFAAALTLFVVAMRSKDVTVAPATWAAIAHATLATAILLADADVEVVEAYTAVPAVLMLIVGTTRLVRDEQTGSYGTLLPGLLVFVIPMALALFGNPDHTGRALWLASGATALLVASVSLRLGAPMIAGAIGVGTVVLTQFTVVTEVVPSWVLFATLGVILVTISATYEARLRDVKRMRERILTYR